MNKPGRDIFSAPGQRDWHERRPDAREPGPSDHDEAAPSRRWSQEGVYGRGAGHDRVDRGPTPPPGRAEHMAEDYRDAPDIDFGGRDTEEYYRRLGSNADRMRERREYQARHPAPDRGPGGEELDSNYHLRAGSRDPRQHYAPAPRRGVSRHAGEGREGYPGGFEEASYGSSPTRQAADHRGRGPRVQRPDRRIVEDLCQRLTEDPVVDASDVDVDCSDGTVVLTGEVDTRAMKYRAEDIVDACPGVRDIDNRLRVRQRGTPRIGHWP